MYEQTRWHPYSYEGRRPSGPDQATLMADIEEVQRKRKYDEETLKNIKEQENILSGRKAAEVAANPYDSPLLAAPWSIPITIIHLWTPDAPAAEQRSAQSDLTTKNASLARINDELKLL